MKGFYRLIAFILPIAVLVSCAHNTDGGINNRLSFLNERHITGTVEYEDKTYSVEIANGSEDIFALSFSGDGALNEYQFVFDGQVWRICCCGESFECGNVTENSLVCRLYDFSMLTNGNINGSETDKNRYVYSRNGTDFELVFDEKNELTEAKCDCFKFIPDRK